MHLYLSALVGFCCIALSSTLLANSAHGPWEVLEGCRLVSAPINDGDSFKVAHQDETFIVRLYFVDCPETHDTYMERVRDQARYFAIAESDVLTAGKLATAHTKQFLRGEFTVITQRADARGGKKTRVFALVSKDDTLLSMDLVSHGLARIYGMPTQGSWPGGVSPRTQLSRLKQRERTAQRNSRGIWGQATGSLQLAGLTQLTANSEHQQTHSAPAPQTPINAHSTSRTGKLILNTASSEALQTLPGIGPALAAEIIAARPIATIDDLAKIPGISLNKVDAFRDQVLTDEPPPPKQTAAYYLADPESYRNTTVTVLVSAVTHSDLAAPDSFRAVQLHTANADEPGGSIAAFIPDEFYDSFMHYYQAPGRSFTGLFFQHESNLVLVYSRQ